jgi:hypothetical protein
MPPRQASVLLADEIFFNLYGKAILHGVYNTDLTIPNDPTLAPQLIFYFLMETDLSEPFKSLGVEVTLPKSEPIRGFVFLPPPQLLAAQYQAQPERTRWYIRHPLLIPLPNLRPGRIEAKVIHDGGEIQVVAPWIVLGASSEPTRTN